MRARALVLVLVLIAALLPLAARAQVAATLVADRLGVTAGGSLRAEGNVEVFHAGTRLSAAAIAYDPATDTLVIEGPIYLVTPDGAILEATRAELDPRLENGILLGARLVLARQVQLAAARIDRVDGRLSQLVRVAATSCRVCGNRPPLWEIRADRVIHDAAGQQLYFEDAVLRVRGLPVAWLPWMRLPDPALARATGFLVPELRASSALGTGIALPYFIRLGDHGDLTLTPHVAALTRTLEARLRLAFVGGDMTVAAAVARDGPAGAATTGGHLAITGGFAPRPGHSLSYDLAWVSDRDFLLDHGLPDRDRLPSRLRYAVVVADSLTTADLTLWQSLRPAEDSGALPPSILGAAHERRLPLGAGTVTLGADALAFARTAPGTGAAARDVLALGFGADWRANAVIGPGLVLDLSAGVDLRARRVGDDPAFGRTLVTLTPRAGLGLRWPLVRRAGDAVDLIEPVVSLGWGTALGDRVPQEDAAPVEFDHGSLADPGRAPGADRPPAGRSLGAGVTWTRRLEAGVSSAGLGAVAAEGDATRFLLSAGVDLAGGLRLLGRAEFDADLDPGATEILLGWQGRSLALDATFARFPADPAGGIAADAADLTLAGDWRINDAWGLRADGRYDLGAGAPVRAGMGLRWSIECVTVDVSLAHRYTETETAPGATSFGLAVTLDGFATDGRAAQGAACRD
ncbi:MAG: LPS-assembly protein LptD [Rubellimicrobium sp.]|nr:LPS-assembly protein LptD [Rubellimicrobium sp.]